jgi:hypothetical protein
MRSEEYDSTMHEDANPPLAPIWVLITYGLWCAPPVERDTSTDTTDEQIAELL